MRIFFSGSHRHLQESQKVEFAKASSQLGFEMAERGHIPLLHSKSGNTVDFHFVKGLRKYSKKINTKVQVEIHRGIRDERIYGDTKDLDVVNIPYQYAGDFLDKRLGARVGGIVSADAVVLIGGKKGTKMVGRLAGDLRKPVIAIGCFEGAAQEAYNVNQAVYLKQISLQVTALQGVWEKDNASRVLDACEILGSRHSYFMSYSHREQESADHVETLLRRSGVQVYRDERELQPNDPLRERVAEQIGRADTFIGLWSKEAKASKWCKWELKKALATQKAGPRPARVVLMSLDDTPLPENMQDFLQLSGTNRTHRSNAIQQLLNTELGTKERVK